MLTAVNPASVFKAPFYSQGIVATGSDRTLYVSGQVGVGADGATPPDIGGQTRQAIANLNAVLTEAGMSAANIAKLTIYLTEASFIPGFSEAAQGKLPAVPPATTLLIVKELASPSLLVEIEAIAVA